MKTPKEKNARLAHFSELYERAKRHHRPTLDRLSLYMAQYLGSDEIDGSDVRATAVRNITYEIIESQISSDIPSPRVSHAGYTEEGERRAAVIERLLTRLRDELPFERQNDLDERYTTIFGGSVWLIEWDAHRALPGEEGGIRVRCLSPEDFIPEPSIPEIEDMEYCFLRFEAPRSELTSRYGVSPDTAALGEREAEGEYADEDTVTVVTCFFREEDGAVSRFIFSGGAVLSDIPDYYARKRAVCPRCACREGGCECGEGSVLSDIEGEVIRLATGEVTVPYYRPRRFPVVIRKNISRAGDWLGQSDCAVIRPQQQAINKLESRIQQKLMRSGVTPVMPEEARVAPDNSVFGQVVRLGPGESASQYGVIDTTPDISQDIIQSDRLYEQARRMVGISDSLVGFADSSAPSGYAKRLQIEQAAGRLESKRRMKEAAYADIDRLMFELCLAFADEAHRVPCLDAQGRRGETVFDRYDFLIFDRTRGDYRFDDGFLFSADRGGAGSERSLLWERNLENLRSGTLGDAKSPDTLLRYWRAQEKAHYPGARENVAYFEGLMLDGNTGREIYGT